jgi:glycosyltransferase involved in cell wall biosynthesis
MTNVLMMPVYNEADGIVEFLDDIKLNLDLIIDYVLVVNDASTDATAEVIHKYSKFGERLLLVENQLNLGHGPSFLKGIQATLSLNPINVITVDGDGQFHASEIAKLFDFFVENNLDVLECARTKRSDPFFRKLVTFSLRLFIFFRVARLPKDANTPLRIYKADILNDFVEKLPKNSLIPNLRFSALARRSNYRIGENVVTSLPRRGISTAGTTWKAKRQSLPSKRFIQFCFKALKELYNHPV